MMRMCSICHEPKSAARIWLQVTDVRVERIKEITEEQAAAEEIKEAIVCKGGRYDI